MKASKARERNWSTGNGYIPSPEKRIEDKTSYEKRNVRSAIYRIEKFIDMFELSWTKYRKKVRRCLYLLFLSVRTEKIHSVLQIMRKKLLWKVIFVILSINDKFHVKKVINIVYCLAWYYILKNILWKTSFHHVEITTRETQLVCSQSKLSIILIICLSNLLATTYIF